MYIRVYGRLAKLGQTKSMYRPAFCFFFGGFLRAPAVLSDFSLGLFLATDNYVHIDEIIIPQYMEGLS